MPVLLLSTRTARRMQLDFDSKQEPLFVLRLAPTGLTCGEFEARQPIRAMNSDDRYSRRRQCYRGVAQDLKPVSDNLDRTQKSGGIKLVELREPILHLVHERVGDIDGQKVRS